MHGENVAGAEDNSEIFSFRSWFSAGEVQKLSLVRYLEETTKVYHGTLHVSQLPSLAFVSCSSPNEGSHHVAKPAEHLLYGVVSCKWSLT